ncbi:MAG: alpha-L-fucosidase [Acidobacteriota bacterium]
MSMSGSHPLLIFIAARLVLASVFEQGMAETEPARPTRQQAEWQDMEFGIFCHFGINTFHDKEWSDGALDPKSFNPADLDAEQWVEAARDAGAKYFILTAKHHDGFCLWPTSTTDYSVKRSPWRDGKGDVVREVANACEKYAVKFGLYLSPWDRHEPCYKDKEAYDEFYKRQLAELLTGYGELVEVWFDGAGSEGRQYDWPGIIALVQEHQPNAMIFNMGAPTIRWVGNEQGFAPYPCWNAVRKQDLLKFSQGRGRADPDGSVWLPAECDARIRRNWFWHSDDSGTLKSVDELMEMYYRSVGRGCNLLLNVGPDRRGLFPEQDAARLREFGAEIARRFSRSLATTSGGGEQLSISFHQPTLVDHAITMEDIQHGERVRKYILEALVNGQWKTVAEGTAIGHKKIDRFPPIRAKRLRFRCLASRGEPKIKRFAVFFCGSPAEGENK